MNILVIDAQGGGLGKKIVAEVKKRFSDATVTAVGTNAIAASNMLKAGADHAAAGENAVLTGCRKADFIIGPIGIVIADALFGEITPKMAVAVAQSSAKRLLIPINRCDNIVIGTAGKSMDEMVGEVLCCLEGE